MSCLHFLLPCSHHHSCFNTLPSDHLFPTLLKLLLLFLSSSIIVSPKSCSCSLSQLTFLHHENAVATLFWNGHLPWLVWQKTLLALPLLAPQLAILPMHVSKCSFSSRSCPWISSSLFSSPLGTYPPPQIHLTIHEQVISHFLPIVSRPSKVMWLITLFWPINELLVWDCSTPRPTQGIFFQIVAIPSVVVLEWDRDLEEPPGDPWWTWSGSEK